MRCAAALALAAPLIASPASAASDTAPSTAITEFQTAWQRITNGQPDQPDPPALQKLAIYPYLVAARLSRDLAEPNASNVDARVAAFLAAHADEPVTRQLTTNWMQSLARRQAWPEFLAHYVPARANAELQCQRFTALIATDATAGLVPTVTKAYLTGNSRPACATAFDWLKTQGALPVTTIEARAQLALDSGNAGLARVLARDLPSASAARTLRWAALISTPGTALPDAIAHPEQPYPAQALLAGFSRLVRNHADDAAALYPQLVKARQLDATAARPFTRLLALGLAWDRSPQALSYFEQLGAVDDGDATAQEWRVRAALWAGDWTRARAWIATLPPALGNDPEWRYWLARAAESTGDLTTADRIYNDLANSNGYYALLASWRLGRGYTPRPAPLVDTPALEPRLNAMPGVVRAHELFQAGLSSQADLEWRIALARATPDEQLQGVWLAHGWGWYAQAIATAARQGVFAAYDLLYPRPYTAAVKLAAQDSALPTDWIYAVTRQESLYNERAISPSGALGLMQLMPATARAVAQRNRLPVPDANTDLFDPDTNLMLGATHLRELIDRENNSLVLALAGYNAGVNAANRWLPAKPLAADVWIENVPYNETRRYIKRILWHIAIFGWEADGKAQNISTLMAPIEPGG